MGSRRKEAVTRMRIRQLRFKGKESRRGRRPERKQCVVDIEFDGIGLNMRSGFEQLSSGATRKLRNCGIKGHYR